MTFTNQRKEKYNVMSIQQYRGRRVKDGSLVHGYAAYSEEGRTYIMIPAMGNSFHIVEVSADSVEPW